MTAVSITSLGGGAASDVWRVRQGDGRDVVVKGSTSAPASYFAAEAAGLRALRELGGLSVPEVLSVNEQSLVLESLDEQLPPDESSWWEDAGRAVARLHGVVGDRFGWDHDGWLGQLRQSNTWDDDGYAFFADHRLRRYLTETTVRQALSSADLSGVESVIERLRKLVPAETPSLLHGDLWRNNFVVGRRGEPAFLDPAVHYGWALDDLAMAQRTGGVPSRFFDAYSELRPLPSDWQEAAEVLYLREQLSVIAHFGALPWAIAGLRSTVQKFR